MDLAPQIRQQLLAVREDVRREVSSLYAEYLQKKTRLDALNVLLNDEAPVLFPDRAKLPEEVPLKLHADIKDSNTITDKAKVLLQQAQHRGMRPKDITRQLREQGVEVKDTFASNFLWRMRYRTNEAVEVGGKYYWKGFEPQTVAYEIGEGGVIRRLRD